MKSCTEKWETVAEITAKVAVKIVLGINLSYNAILQRNAIDKPHTPHTQTHTLSQEKLHQNQPKPITWPKK